MEDRIGAREKKIELSLRWILNFEFQVALREGGVGDAERDVRGGAGHWQRPLLGALRLHQVRPARLARLRGMSHLALLLFLGSSILFCLLRLELVFVAPPRYFSGVNYRIYR